MVTQAIPVGAKVSFRIGGSTLVGRVLEDRGPIGNGGRHLYGVRYEADKGNWSYTELPAAEIETVEFKTVDPRKRREIQYIVPYEAVEAHSLFAKHKHAWPLAEFLRSQNVRFATDPDAVEGEVNFLIDKSTPWQEFVSLLNEWKRQYAEEPSAPQTVTDPLGS